MFDEYSQQSHHSYITKLCIRPLQSRVFECTSQLAYDAFVISKAIASGKNLEQHRNGVSCTSIQKQISKSIPQNKCKHMIPPIQITHTHDLPSKLFHFYVQKAKFHTQKAISFHAPWFFLQQKHRNQKYMQRIHIKSVKSQKS